jgi:hypothetical protein
MSLSKLTASQFSILKGRPYCKESGIWAQDYGASTWARTSHRSQYLQSIHNTGELINYFQKEMFSPTKSAPIKAVKQGHLITWPGLAEDAIIKHLKMTPSTSVGHMNQERQNTRSTSKEIQVTSEL